MGRHRLEREIKFKLDSFMRPFRSSVLLAAALLASSASAQDTALVKREAEPHALQPEFNEIKSIVYRRSCLSVARVTRVTPLGPETATGFFVAPGKMITLLSAIDGGKLSISYGITTKERLVGEVLASDPYTGLALLGVEPAVDVPQIKPSKSASSVAGSFVYAVGETDDIAKACAVGRIAGRDRGLGGELLATSLMRLNLDVGPEMTGAPLLDKEAKLVGVVLAGEGEREGRSYALPVELVSKLLADHEAHGKVRAPWLGFGMRMGTSTPEVRSLQPGSPAELAGMQINDVILSINARAVEDYQQVIDACYVLTVGTATEFSVLRGLDKKTLKVVPTERIKKTKAAHDASAAPATKAED